MIQKLLSVFQKNPPALPRDVGNNDVAKELRQRKWSVFLAATFGYGFYYVCRLTMSVVKKPIVDSGLLDVSEIGIVGSALFFAYAAGKLVNGVLADRLNVRVFMAIADKCA
jgi:OPA family sugar phosphate sensor protein UhpC-like MFS transporter